MIEKILHPIGYDDIYIECDNNEICGACFAETRMDKVRDLHKPEAPTAICHECGSVYPCATIQALDGEQYGWSGIR